MSIEIQIGDITLNSQTGQAQWIQGNTRLTSKEMHLLQALNSASGTVTKQALMDVLWPNQEVGGRNRLLVALHRLKKKIAGSPIQIVYDGEGYQLDTGEALSGLSLSDRLLDLDKRCVVFEGERIALTKMEVQLLNLLVKKPNLYWPRSELIHELWGAGAGDKNAALNTLVHGLRQKLETLPAKPRHLKTASRREIGLFCDVAEETKPPVEPAVQQEAPFVGRTEVLLQLIDTLQAGTRCVNILGPGGQGKTRLARQLMTREELTSLYPGGIVFCDLASCTTPVELVFQAASSLELKLPASTAPGELAATLGRMLAIRPRNLLVLDNFEQVVEHGGETLGIWARLAPQVQFVVTSRRRLGLSVEQVIPLEPLPLPDAMTLFLGRARRLQPELRLGLSERKRIAPLLARLEFNALAILLSAGQLQESSFEEWADALEQYDDASDVLRDVLERSWRLLSAADRAVLGQATEFRGGFTLEAAESILSVEDDWVDEVIERLLDHSLLYMRETQGQIRYFLYESVRLFAAARAEYDKSAVQQRFVDLYLDLSQQFYQAFVRDGWSLPYPPSVESANVSQVMSFTKDHPDLGWGLIYLMSFGGYIQFGVENWLSLAEQVQPTEGSFKRLRKCRINALRTMGRDHKPLLKQIIADASENQSTRTVAQRDLIMAEGNYSLSAFEKVNQLVLQQLNQVTDGTDVEYHGWLLIEKSQYLSITGRPHAAVEVFRAFNRLRYTENAPLNIPHVQLHSYGVTLFYAGYLTESERALTAFLNWVTERNLSIGGEKTLLFSNLGSCVALQGRLAEAADWYKTGVLTAESQGVLHQLHSNLGDWAMCAWLMGDVATARDVFARHGSSSSNPILECKRALFLLHHGDAEAGRGGWNAHQSALLQSGYAKEDWDALWQAHVALAETQAGWEEAVVAVCARPMFWLPREPRPDTGEGGGLQHMMFVIALEVLAQQKNPTQP